MKRPLTANDVTVLLGLERHPLEGGYFTETFRDAASTAIYYLLTATEFSAMHRLPGPEIFHFYAGAPVRMLLLAPEAAATQPVMGAGLVQGQRPQLVVPGGVWQGATTLGEWSLVGTTMAPGFDPADYDIGDPDELTAAWPDAAAEIALLTR